MSGERDQKKMLKENIYITLVPSTMNCFHRSCGNDCFLFFVFFKLGIIPSMHLHRAQLEGKVRSTDGHLGKVQFLHFQQSLTHINGYFIQNNIYWKNEDKLGSEAKFCSPQCNKYKLLILV